MKYRVILAFEGYSVGQVIEPTGLWAGELKRRGYIEPIPEEPKPKAIFGPRRKKNGPKDIFIVKDVIEGNVHRV